MKNSVESLLEDDHESLNQLLTELEAELEGSNLARAFELLDHFWARLAVHIRAENLHLFPALDNASFSLFTGRGKLPTPEEAHNILLRLRSDHGFFMTELGQMMKTAREIVGHEEDPWEEIKEMRRKISEIKDRLKDHNEVEEKRVYTWPSLLFDKKTVSALRDRLRHELENLPPRFEGVISGHPLH